MTSAGDDPPVREPHWYGCGRAVSLAVQLPYIARHFHTGDELGVNRFSSGLAKATQWIRLLSKKWTIVSLPRHERLAHFARIAENWSAEDPLLTPPDWQFRDRPGSHRELGCHQIAPTNLINRVQRGR